MFSLSGKKVIDVAVFVSEIDLGRTGNFKTLLTIWLYSASVCAELNLVSSVLTSCVVFSIPKTEFMLFWENTSKIAVWFFILSRLFFILTRVLFMRFLGDVTFMSKVFKELKSLVSVTVKVIL